MNEIIKKMITQAVNYEIENDEKLYGKIQKMRVQGGTASMKEYWKEFRHRFNGYSRVLETEISYSVKESMKERIFILITFLITINMLTAVGVAFIVQKMFLIKF